jgi:hypothetical protein
LRIKNDTGIFQATLRYGRVFRIFFSKTPSAEVGMSFEWEKMDPIFPVYTTA